ncbi:DUF4147 domain-containing protein [Candidatus Peregrinibacteria bacterium]|nr:DUF4147 domain-containing protein [Candidatus Peregrinibacteria bacterium]
MLSNNEETYIQLFKDLIDPLFEKISPRNLIRDALRGRDFSKYKRIFVIGAGKASVVMAKSVENYFNALEQGHIIYPDNQNKLCLKKITATAASHPLPNEKGIEGSRKIMKIADKAQAGDLVISLISGGGSALMPLPVEGLELNEKIDLSKQLIRSGATINEINVVRKHVSKIKGGYLARAVYPADCLNLVISDVVGDDLSTIASGPLSPDPSSREDAKEILDKYNIDLPDVMKETPKPGDECFTKVETKILANHETSALAAFDLLEDVDKEIIDTNLEGNVKEVVEKILGDCTIKHKIYIYSGETTVEVKGDGYGGRNQEFVLLALKEMRDMRKNFVIMSLATDGVDGFCPEDVAGAVVGPSTIKKNPEIDKYLDNNDSYSYFKSVGGLIRTGSTGNNLGDLMLVVLI